jgi:hypothetical protein
VTLLQLSAHSRGDYVLRHQLEPSLSPVLRLGGWDRCHVCCLEVFLAGRYFMARDAAWALNSLRDFEMDSGSLKAIRRFEYFDIGSEFALGFAVFTRRDCNAGMARAGFGPSTCLPRYFRGGHAEYRRAILR